MTTFEINEVTQNINDLTEKLTRYSNNDPNKNIPTLLKKIAAFLRSLSKKPVLLSALRTNGFFSAKMENLWKVVKSHYLQFDIVTLGILLAVCTDWQLVLLSSCPPEDEKTRCTVALQTYCDAANILLQHLGLKNNFEKEELEKIASEKHAAIILLTIMLQAIIAFHSSTNDEKELPAANTQVVKLIEFLKSKYPRTFSFPLSFSSPIDPLLQNSAMDFDTFEVPDEHPLLSVCLFTIELIKNLDKKRDHATTLNSLDNTLKNLLPKIKSSSVKYRILELTANSLGKIQTQLKKPKGAEPPLQKPPSSEPTKKYDFSSLSLPCCFFTTTVVTINDNPSENINNSQLSNSLLFS